MKTLIIYFAILTVVFFCSCEEDTLTQSCTEGVILGPVCPYGAGYLGYSVFVKDSIPQAIPYNDPSLGDGFVVAVLNLSEAYQTQTGMIIYFTAREATAEEIGTPNPMTANCVQPPLIVIEKINSSCTTPEAGE